MLRFLVRHPIPFIIGLHLPSSSHTGPLASELWPVLFPLPGRPLLPDELLCILQSPTRTSPPLKHSSLHLCCHSTSQAPEMTAAQPLAQLSKCHPSPGKVGKGQTRGGSQGVLVADGACG